jgi:hypothetical protein
MEEMELLSTMKNVLLPSAVPFRHRTAHGRRAVLLFIFPTPPGGCKRRSREEDGVMVIPGQNAAVSWLANFPHLRNLLIILYPHVQAKISENGG